MSENRADYIGQLLIAMEENDIAEIKVEHKDLKINLQRETAADNIVFSNTGSCIDNNIIVENTIINAVPQNIDSGSYLTQNNNEEVLVKSPVVGIYHQFDSITVGMHVKSGQKLAFVDILAIKKEITSPVSGIISEIHVEENSGVEYGEPLFSIIPA